MSIAPALRTFAAALVAAVAFTLMPAPAAATWAIIALDSNTGIVVIASATCVSAEGLRTRGGLKSI